jgi:hypothetical protein
VTFRIADAAGVTVASSTAAVTMAIGTNPGGGTLSGTLTVNAVAGVATFSNLSINNPGNGYTLVATSTGLTSATSTPFTVGTTHLVFLIQPGGGAAGAVWAQQPVVAVENTLNQVITTDQTTVVSLAIWTNPAGGTLSCASGTSRTVVNGKATFSGCSISIGSATTYILAATSVPAATRAISSNFLIVAPSAPSTVAISNATAIGNVRSGFTIATKVVWVGTDVTIRFEMSPALANRAIGIWIARKVNGTWTSFSPHASVQTDASGVAYYVYSAGSAAWLSFQGRFVGYGSTGPARSFARQARWIR